MKPKIMFVTLLAAAIGGQLQGAAADEAGYAEAVELERYRVETSPYVFRASDIIGREVHNAAGEEIGDIDDLVLSRSDMKVHAVLAIGGVLGLGEKLVAVPCSDLRLSRDGEHVFVNATEADLKARPGFTYNEGERGALFVDTEARKDADNTARNVRDRDGATKTPVDQSSREADVETTREIRKSMLQDESLSINAHNVKIITEGGQVTLRGPVASVAERERLLSIAKVHAGTNAVRNELEVERD